MHLNEGIGMHHHSKPHKRLIQYLRTSATEYSLRGLDSPHLAVVRILITPT